MNSPLKNFRFCRYDSGGGEAQLLGTLGAIVYGQSAMNNIETESGQKFVQGICTISTLIGAS